MIKNFVEKYRDFGLLFIRIGIGIAFVFTYGMMKIQAGPEMWTMIGSAMTKIGITFGHTVFGFLAAASEFFGGMLLILGLFTRTTALFMAFTMLMASITHLSRLDPWNVAILPMELFAVFMGLVFLGAGKYSLNYLFFERKKNSAAGNTK
jgi:putative oxidoreductase